jgi:hypothetical protein
MIANRRARSSRTQIGIAKMMVEDEKTKMNELIKEARIRINHFRSQIAG